MMAVWEVLPPRSVMKPSTWASVIWVVSAGDRSRATTMTGSGKSKGLQGVLAGEVSHEAAVDRLHVRQAAPDVVVADARKSSLIFSKAWSRARSALRRSSLDEPQGLGVQHPVPEDEQVQFQEMGVLGQIDGDLLARRVKSSWVWSTAA